MQLLSDLGLNIFSSRKYFQQEGIVWGTSYSITYKSRRDLSSEIFKIFELVDFSLSMYNTQSLLSRINRNEISTIDKAFAQVFEIARMVSELSKGKYDCTVKPLVDLWGFGTNSNVHCQPSHDEIMKTIKTVGIEQCRIFQGNIIKKNHRTAFDFSSLAKGYGVDCISEMFNRNGISDYIIQIGGEVLVKGYNPRGENWRIKLRTNKKDMRGLNFMLDSKAVATSGIYYSHKTLNGLTYGHIINPKTGYPIETERWSVSVIADSCAMADALSTACFMMSFPELQNMSSEYPSIKVELNTPTGNYNEAKMITIVVNTTTDESI